jgi:hypothetical protein
LVKVFFGKENLKILKQKRIYSDTDEEKKIKLNQRLFLNNILLNGKNHFLEIIMFLSSAVKKCLNLYLLKVQSISLKKKI